MDDPTRLTNKERLQHIEGRLTDTEQALALRASEPKKPLLARAYESAINHKGTSLILSIALCFSGVGIAYWLNNHTEWRNKEIDGRVEEVLRKPDGVMTTLSHINETVMQTDTRLKTLEPFIHDVITKQFENASNLSSATLRDRLPAIQHLVAVADAEKVQIDPKVIKRLGDHLAEVQAINPKSPQVWPAVSTFINYRSNVLLAKSAEIAASSKKPCTAAFGAFTFSVEFYDGSLDISVFPDVKSPSGAYPWVKFVRCTITYNGGPIYASIVIFQDCVFNFNVPTAPPKRGEDAMRQLVAAKDQNLITIKLG